MPRGLSIEAPTGAAYLRGDHVEYPQDQDKRCRSNLGMMQLINGIHSMSDNLEIKNRSSINRRPPSSQWYHLLHINFIQYFTPKINTVFKVLMSDSHAGGELRGPSPYFT